MKRVAYVCADPGIAVFGTKGASVHVQEIVRAFRADGWLVTVYCSRRGDQVPDDLADLTVVEVRVGAGDDTDRETRIGAVAAELADAAIADGTDLVYERYALFSRAGARVAIRTGVPLVVEVNAPLIDEQRRHRVLHDEQHAVQATRDTFGAASVITCVSSSVADWVAGIAPAAGPVVVAPNGVNTSRIVPSTRTGDGPFTVGFVGTLKPWHGVDVLVRAFAAAAEPDWRLMIIGDGPQRSALTELAAELGLGDQVQLTGALPPADVPAALGRIDVAVAPYPADPDHYFSPLKLAEYFAAGLAVVASRIGQIPELVRPEQTGLLVPPGDVAELAAALRRLAEDPVLRRRLGTAARRHAEATLGWDDVLRRALGPLMAVAP